MQASDFDSSLETYFALTALPLNQQLSRNFGTLNALPKEIIEMIFSELSIQDMGEARLVSKACFQIVTPEYNKIRAAPLKNFEGIRPHIHELYGMKNYMNPYQTTNFILGKEGDLVAMSGSDEIMLAKDEEGNFKISKDFVSSNEHSTLTTEWSKTNRQEQSVKISKMPEKGYAKNVAEAMAFLAPRLYQGSFSLSYKNRAPGQQWIDWKNVFKDKEKYTMEAILEAGKKL